jgi:predicted O-methyltransferase YrrM
MNHERRAAKEEARQQRRSEFDVLRKACRLRELPVAAIFEGILEQAVPLGAINEETGHDNHAEMLYVIAVAAHLRRRRIFEFGTFLGRTTLHLARACPDAAVTTLDLPAEENPWAFGPHVGSYFAGTPEAARITQIRHSSMTFDPSPLAGTMDFVWVDGDHGYEAVKNDTGKALALLAPGGVILWHDFGPDSLDLVRFFQDFTQERPLFRIRKTSVLLHIDGVDPLTFEARAVPFTKAMYRPNPKA